MALRFEKQLMPARSLVLLVACATVGCASRSLSSTTSSVQVLTNGIPDSCVRLLAVSATDGAVEPAARPFDGTRERAIEELKRRAALYGANAIAIDESATLASVAFEGARGSSITLGADAYKCSTQ